MRFNLLKTKIKSIRNKEKSRGRSMVEMLGVLAIIGVLSIGGIQGYTLAMRKYQVNEILSTGAKYATLIWSTVQNDSDRFVVHKVSQYDKYQYYDKSQPLNNYDNYRILNASSVSSFLDSGLGGLPSGAEDISFMTITGGQSGMSVDIKITFKNQELCRTAKAMTDCNENDSKGGKNVYICEGTSYHPDEKNILSVRFYQD